MTEQWRPKFKIWTGVPNIYLWFQVDCYGHMAASAKAFCRQSAFQIKFNTSQKLAPICISNELWHILNFRTFHHLKCLLSVPCSNVSVSGFGGEVQFSHFNPPLLLLLLLLLLLPISDVSMLVSFDLPPTSCEAFVLPPLLLLILGRWSGGEGSLPIFFCQLSTPTLSFAKKYWHC